MRANSSVKSRVSRFASALGAFLLAFGVLAFGTPAHADIVNPEMPFKISGNVQNKGVGIPGVSISMTGPAGFTATVLTDAEGKYTVGIPEKLNY
jgi:branched-chain amino acid transport system permease protein